MWIITLPDRARLRVIYNTCDGAHIQSCIFIGTFITSVGNLLNFLFALFVLWRLPEPAQRAR
jgi:hypothetical protein